MGEQEKWKIENVGITEQKKKSVVDMKEVPENMNKEKKGLRDD